MALDVTTGGTRISRFYTEVMSRGRIELLEELTTEDFVATFPDYPPIEGRRRLRDAIVSYRERFPDLKITVLESITEGERICCRCRVEMTHVAEYEGLAPTGRLLRFEAVDLFHMQGDKIRRRWHLKDKHSILRQIRG